MFFAQRPSKPGSPSTGSQKRLDKSFNDEQRAESDEDETPPGGPSPYFFPDDPSRPREPVPMPSYPQIPHHALRRLRDLDKTSPQFHQQLGDFLRGKEYRDALSSRQSEAVSVWVVEYLDSVGPRIILLRNMLTIGTGSYGNSGSPKPCFPGTLE